MTSSPPSTVGEKSSERTAVAVFAFKRPGLLRQTLRSLERNDGFGNYPVYVFSEAPRHEVAGEAEPVHSVRKVLREWCERTGARLHEAESNQGLRRSIVTGVNVVLAAHERIIVIEDDLILSRCFLPFMRDALEACEGREEIMQVSGHFIPHTADLPPVGLIRSPGSWGWATWRRAWAHYSDDAGSLLSKISDSDAAKFDFSGSYAFLDALSRNANGTLDTWAVRWYASMFLKGGYAIYPSCSFVRNIGYGDDATNTPPSRTARVFMNQPISDRLPPLNFSELAAGESPAFARALEDFYRWQQAEWTRPTIVERLRARWRLLTAGD